MSIHNRNLDFKVLEKLNISSDELKKAMREEGIEFFKDVKLAINKSTRKY
ncbi:YetF domain-containing protein [Flavobacterium caseinilyticum]|nr:YetF domain-containing protein [Flavobacterium caseinilyticum]